MIWSASGGRGRLRRLSGRCSRSGRSEPRFSLRLKETQDPPFGNQGWGTRREKASRLCPISLFFQNPQLEARTDFLEGGRLLKVYIQPIPDQVDAFFGRTANSVFAEFGGD